MPCSSPAYGQLQAPPRLRLQHIHGALTPRCRGEVVRALHGVVAVLSDGQTPPLMRSWVAIASFAALREKR